MQTLESIYKEIAQNNSRWSYYACPDFCLSDKWVDNSDAMDFIVSYFDYAGKSHCLNDQHFENNLQHITERATHIISTFIIGIKLFECFDIETDPRDKYDMNLKYYWFLTCLYHDIGYAFENNSTCKQLRMLQTDGLDAIQEIASIKYLHSREFITFTKEEINLYLKGRAYCVNGHRGCVDHGIVGGLLLYNKLRKQFEISWKKVKKPKSRESFYIKDECHERQLHLSNKHYDAYARAADAIMTHNIFHDTFNRYIDELDISRSLNKLTEKDRISSDNVLCFVLAIADTVEPLKRCLRLSDVGIEALQNNCGVRITIDKIAASDKYTQSIKDLQKWVRVTVDGDQTINNECIVLSVLNRE